ncbi:MAG: UDP-N-acetylmuramoyl-tripeptide--D-alanyl-D-alanine ligase [Burkholderiales bacterium]
MGMMQLSEAVSAVRAQRIGDDVIFDAVTTDSRSASAGDLFVALHGEHFDGHQFIGVAAQHGAVAAMVQSDIQHPLPQLVVANTRLALGQLAGYWRERFLIPMVAITGSNGKTTVKEMLASILRAATANDRQPMGAETVLATQGNLNNDIGVPLTLLKLRDSHRYAVVEMGMNHRGEIDYLSRLAKPDVALINNAHAAHLEGLGSVQQVALAKGEIFAGLKNSGVAVINADDPNAALWRELTVGRRVLDFGLRNPAQVHADYRLQAWGSQVSITTPAARIATELRVCGLHNVYNALAATAAATALDVNRQAIAAGLALFSGVKGRLQRHAGLNGATFIDDTYNANPASVQAALQVLAACAGKKIFVLGDMGELGSAAVQLHAGIGEQARNCGVDVMYALGELSGHAVRQFGRGALHFETIAQLLAELENVLAPDVTVLVKGSRFMKMERVVRSFTSET